MCKTFSIIVWLQLRLQIVTKKWLLFDHFQRCPSLECLTVPSKMSLLSMLESIFIWLSSACLTAGSVVVLPSGTLLAVGFGQNLPLLPARGRRSLPAWWGYLPTASSTSSPSSPASPPHKFQCPPWRWRHPRPDGLSPHGHKCAGCPWCRRGSRK